MTRPRKGSTGRVGRQAPAETSSKRERDVIALLRFLDRPARFTVKDERAVLIDADGRRRTVQLALVRALAKSGAIERDGTQLSRGAAGAALLRRLLAGNEAYGAQHRDVTREVLRDRDGSTETVTVNRAHSPLGRLARLRGADGEPFLHPELVQAGERLSTDFERAHLRQRVTADWSPVRAAGGGDGSGMAELTGAALAARERWNRAVGALGPELGAATVDLCCFGKGLSAIEAERGWPRRSGKIMLRAGLEQLARHYCEPRRKS